MLKASKRHVFIISALLVFGFIITSLSSYYVSRVSLKEEILMNSLPLTSDNIYSEIQRDILQPVFISSLMANDTFFRDWVVSGEKDVNQISKYLNEIKEKYNTITSFFVSDKTLNYYYSQGILKKVKPDAERDIWYFRVKNMKAPYEINVDPDMANNDAMTIFINYKVFDYNNNFVGATGVGLSVFSVKNLIKNYQQKYDRNIYFMNTGGDIILSSRKLDSDYKNIEDLKGLSYLEDKILRTKSASLTYVRDNDTYYLNTRYIPEFKWYLLVEQNASKASRGIFDTLIINLVICFIITSIIVFITILLINSYQNKLHNLAATDELTGLYNRRALNIIWDHILRDAERHKESFSAVILDIDDFKKVNDSHGHAAGDEILKNISELLTNNIRSSDSVFRWGGEEFFIIFKSCNIDDAVNNAEKIRKCISESRFTYTDKEIKITVSIGAAEYKVDESRDDFFSRIDTAMYSAKQKGKNMTVKV